MVFETMLAPIVLFVYNRPWHTEQTLNALAANRYADESVLYIYADGPKEKTNYNENLAINEVRKLIRKKQWCRDVYIIESESNRGLADSIVRGVTQVIKNHGRIIVLEDDVVTSPTFLKYMNDAITIYEKDSNVYQISGFMIPNKRKMRTTGFFRAPASWGWATWARAWHFFSEDSELLFQKISSCDVNHFNIDATYDYMEQLDKNRRGEIRTWVVKWYASLYLKQGLCLYPHRSLVKNIGFDGSGVHCGKNDMRLFNRMKIIGNIDLGFTEMKESEEYLEAFKEFYRMLYRRWTIEPLYKRIIARLKRTTKLIWGTR